jgi:FAD/FMN-containing dehydrogenase
MTNTKDDLKNSGFRGEILDDAATKEEFSHDASMFELVPETVVCPTDTKDVQALVDYVNKARQQNNKQISVTARSGGTDMSGGAITESILMNMTKHFKDIKSVNSTDAHVQPGVYYRDFEKRTLAHHALMPSYPASREICTVGGMVANNSGGEKSLQFGKTENFVTELEVVLADGKAYRIKPLKGEALKSRLAQKDFEGKLYRQVYDLLDQNYDLIKSAKPKVTKDSTGYHAWNVWDRETGVFDLNKLIIGSQGTLGLITDIKFKLVPAPKHSGTLVIFLHKINNLGEVINKVLQHKPATFEGFDNYTLMLSFKLFYYFHTTLGWWGMLKLGLQLLPDALLLFRGIPKMVLLVEFNDESPAKVAGRVKALHEDLKVYSKQMVFEENETEAKAQKFWIMRRESFNLLRKKVKDKHTAPFIDDLVVPPQHLPEFLPKLRKILNKYKLLATVAGHMGDGNFHVIPLMNIEDPKERKKLGPCMKEVNELVLSYGGSLSGEHNDGMVRGPWLDQMYSKDMMRVFRKIKNIFDPDNIFNPHKKTDAAWEYTMSHIRKHF